MAYNSPLSKSQQAPPLTPPPTLLPPSSVDREHPAAASCTKESRDSDAVDAGRGDVGCFGAGSEATASSRQGRAAAAPATGVEAPTGSAGCGRGRGSKRSAVGSSGNAAGAASQAPTGEMERPARRPKKADGTNAGDASMAAPADVHQGGQTAAPGNPAVDCAEEDAAAGASSSNAADERTAELAKLQAELEQSRNVNSQHRHKMHSAHEKIKSLKAALSVVLVQIAKTEAAEERDRIEAMTHQLGRVRQAVVPDATRQTVWDIGYEAEELQREFERIKEDKADIERLRRKFDYAKRKRRAAVAPASAPSEDGGGGASASNAGGGNGVEDAADDADDAWETRETFKFRFSFLGTEEQACKDREQRLQNDRALHLKKLQLMEAADRSTFRHYPLFPPTGNARYQLLNMLGRGGFSEVYRAYDLENNRYCAVKIHELASEMTSQQAQSYVRRAMREYEIQKALKHPRVVQLLDFFPISQKAFATVLELCEGETLDEYCKKHGGLPEKEVRGILIQLISGLKYLNGAGRNIIHYDIKPGNIFWHCGEVKIADFGLSKVAHESGASIELTSQGAGTYWYLPPECILPGDRVAKISNKVDVWSSGVVCFELLFRRRPFGHGQSQEALVRAAMAGQSFDVDIPAQPKVSNECKEFLKRLLTVRREDRPDINEAYNDAYLRPNGRRVAAAAAAAVAAAAAAAANGSAQAGTMEPPRRQTSAEEGTTSVAAEAGA
eukprot:TRINITY_DN90724_c0_g1_i1.p1 TRINITY_DN90724_c0_g1~~TRINITY_DN90724_c0_g1_i1.p1  ORF type:complete len:727 (-),score=178.99 TRINITY_DN90724_c0_g1_i1:110-2290(-)